MTVKELIKELLEKPPKAKVVLEIITSTNDVISSDLINTVEQTQTWRNKIFICGKTESL